MAAVAGIIIPGVRLVSSVFDFSPISCCTAFTSRQADFHERLRALTHFAVLQLLTKIGVLAPLPSWVDAGKVWIEGHPSFPLGKRPPYML